MTALRLAFPAVLLFCVAACSGKGLPPLELTQLNPADGATEVPLGSPVSVRLSKPLDCATLTAGSIALTSPAGPVSGSITCAGGEATFTPAAPLAPDTLHEVAVASGFRAVDGTVLPGPVRARFTTGRLTVRSMSPATGSTAAALGSAVVHLDFWAPMDCATVDGRSLALSSAAGPVPAAIVCGGTFASIVPAAPLSPGTAYAVDATASARSQAGYHLVPFHAEFTTPAAVAVDAAVTNGPVWNIATSEDGRTIYLGGEFTAAGPRTGSFVPVSAISGKPAGGGLPQVDGSVLAVAADRAGGWYLGGLFSIVAGTPRQNLAHLLSDGSLDPSWNPGANAEVSALAVAGGAVYVGGRFTAVAGQPRSHLAALDPVAGSALSWAPEADGAVRALAVVGSTVYAAGAFQRAGGQPRSRLAALDAGTGAATSWDPGSDGEVLALAPAGTTLYVGGSFATAGGQPRANLAAIDLAGGGATSWNPGADGAVWALAAGAGAVYAAGDFGTAGGAPREHLAAIDATTGAATAFRTPALAPWRFGGKGSDYPRLFAVSGVPPSATQGANYSAPGVLARALAVSGSAVYLGGWFDSAGGARRAGAAAFDSSTGALLPWDPASDGIVYALAASGEAVAVAGNFGSVGAVPRMGFAAIDALTGAVTPWDPGAEEGNCWFHSAHPILVRGPLAYIGGSFAKVQGTPRRGLAAVDASSGALAPFDPGPQLEQLGPPMLCPHVVELALGGSTLYAHGFFDHLGSLPRRGLGAIDLETGLVTPWELGTDAGGMGNVDCGLDVVGSSVFVCSASYDATTGSKLWARQQVQWRSSADAWAAYVADTYGDVHVEGVDLRTGQALWGPVLFAGSPYTAAQDLAPAAGRLFVAGYFTSASGVPRANLAALDARTGAVTAWDPSANDPVNAVLPSGPTVLAGGWFSAMGGQARRGFAILAP